MSRAGGGGGARGWECVCGKFGGGRVFLFFFSKFPRRLGGVAQKSCLVIHELL